jgi:hypothetical protein
MTPAKLNRPFLAVLLLLVIGGTSGCQRITASQPQTYFPQKGSVRFSLSATFARHLADAFGLGDLAALVLALLSHQRPNGTCSLTDTGRMHK